MRGLLVLFPLLAGCLLYEADEGDPTDPEQGHTRVIGAGWSFGECWGLCSGRLDRIDETLALTLTSNNNDEPDLVQRGRLTPTAAAELAAIDRDLAAARLAETYGCPGCDDGRASHVDIVYGDIVTRTTYEGDAPPPALVAADAFLTDIMNAMQTCTASARVVLDSCAAP